MSESPGVISTSSTPPSSSNEAEYAPLVSIILPARNEEADLGRTLEAVVKLDYPHKEALVVDDGSTDRTYEIIQEFAGKHDFIKALRLRESRGAASARNAGIRASRGEILVILNADVLLQKNFLDLIVPHYKNGADYVCVESEVINQDSPFSRYTQAFHHAYYGGKSRKVSWSEGFSCRRSVAFDAGLFPEEIPGCGGEDIVFGAVLFNQYKRVTDFSIVVPHVAPATMAGFWGQQKGRGRGSAFTQTYEGRFLPYLFLKFTLKMFYRPIHDFLAFPALFFSYLRSPQKVNRGMKDFFPFLYAAGVRCAANSVGEWSGWIEILAKRKKPQI